jgi:hypothetical protein
VKDIHDAVAGASGSVRRSRDESRFGALKNSQLSSEYASLFGPLRREQAFGTSVIAKGMADIHWLKVKKFS